MVCDIAKIHADVYQLNHYLDRHGHPLVELHSDGQVVSIISDDIIIWSSQDKPYGGWRELRALVTPRYDISPSEPLSYNIRLAGELGLPKYDISPSEPPSYNIRLASELGLPKEQIREIENLHGIRRTLKDKMATVVKNNGSLTDLRSLADDITQIEYYLQDAWGFKRDRRYHEFWTLPGCSCPVIDNRERKGTDYLIIDESCPLHGDIDKK